MQLIGSLSELKTPKPSAAFRISHVGKSVSDQALLNRLALYSRGQVFL